MIDVIDRVLLIIAVGIISVGVYFIYSKIEYRNEVVGACKPTDMYNVGKSKVYRVYNCEDANITWE